MARRLLATYLTITALVLVVVVVPLGLTFASRERDRLVFDIERDAQAVASLSEDALEGGAAPAIDVTLREYADTGGRIVVVDDAGIAVADSDDIGGDPRDFSTRPEIVAALDGERVSGTRSSETLGAELMYVAVPVASGGTVHGAVRVTYPTSALDARVRSTWWRLGALSAVALGVVALVGVVLARSVTRPVKRLQDASVRLAGGDLDARVRLEGGAPELQELAETFNITARRLGGLVESQRRFVADASHQLRTPLTALRLRLETLEPVVSEEASSKLDAAIAETARLARLVQSLLVLARSETSVPECQAVDLPAVVADRAAAWRPVAAEQAVDLSTDCEDSCRVWAAPEALEQIMDNLLANALEVAPARSTVTISVKRGATMAELHVLDEGPGMTREARAHAFERFWRSEDAQSGGFGLGLAIVQQLAEACGGGARLDAAPDGRGLDAVVELQRAEPGTTSAPPHPPDRRAVDAHPALTSA